MTLTLYIFPLGHSFQACEHFPPTQTRRGRDREGGITSKGVCYSHRYSCVETLHRKCFRFVFFPYPSHIPIAMGVFAETSQLMCTVSWATPSNCASRSFLTGLYVSETQYPSKRQRCRQTYTPYTPNTVTPLLPIPFSETVHISKISMTAVNS